ncbi:MAG: hypothetical protein A3I44_01580 [Candidatus Sungbacteria bacterium RIFCSPLOWO2_02_FULL_51_17]|uniref:Septum formation initiator n=1 Tax=Candidatus Sungbacteria bacterium RIFCSPHIGHO2_02_FULL_51_29 TaxID=1802273 RepID=A0A1G2KWB8_9BACT|nr:MAG: hypothetical protein A2676_00745 [Candidatus Sungbacteria bacterium RIFCSPHIGHO2_01_FULL_51_22]OHA03474.1 MAG: hypothetical protein A3C16_00010 [Candidatus Sungbacteria bacterium RIFCSPHIGHO2_02_FULL_51_29]OHA10589.1 MAG: hypothetical protein A3I44_01580 [Candidatus Sungbacteria bacterium RIFCSPLOWO2_02_FULL_51_17]
MSHRGLKKFLTSPLLYIAGGIILSLFVFNARVVFFRAWSVWRENNELEQRVLASEKKNQELADEIAYARSEGFREREGKARLNLKRSGEEVVVILPKKEVPATTVGAGGGFWRRIFTWIGAPFGF